MQLRLNVNRVILQGGISLRWFECPCCHQVRVSPELVELVDQVRGLFRGRLAVVRGYVCAGRAATARRGTLSAHHWGNAVDLAPEGDGLAALAEAAQYCGGRNININSRRGWVHVEVNVPEGGHDIKKDGSRLAAVK